MSLFAGIIGNVSPPPQFTGSGYNANVTVGLMPFISNIIKLVIVIGGLVAFINLIMAGFSYIISGDNPEELNKAHQRIYMSLIGLVLMVGSFVLTGVISFLLFGDASAILNPQIYGPTNN